MTLRAIPPMALSSANTTSTAAESIYTAYAAGTAYALDATCTDGGRDYKSLQAANTGHTPASSPTWWLDLGPSNKWQMFDAERNTATTATSPLTAVITPGQRVDAMALYGVVADSVTITQTYGGGTVYTKTIGLLDRITLGWSDYFFGTFEYRESVWVFDLLPYTTGTVTIVFSRSSGSVSCETVVLGTAVEIGSPQYGAESDIVDFSNIERDGFGSATLIKRKNVPRMSVSMMITKAQINRIRRLRETLAASPAAWIGMDNSQDGYADAVSMLGIFKRMPIVIEHSLVNLEIEGL